MTYPSPAEQRFAEWASSQGWDVTKRGWPDFICRRDGAIMACTARHSQSWTPRNVPPLLDM